MSNVSIMLDTLLIKSNGRRATAILTTAVRVRSHLGTGVFRYVTSDGYIGVQLDGEDRVEEIPVEQVVVSAAEAT